LDLKKLLDLPQIQVDRVIVDSDWLREIFDQEERGSANNRLLNQRISSNVFHVSIARLDQVHPQVSGNKWFKLRFNLAKAAFMDADAVLSFGGAWSNHLHALAAAGKQLSLPTIGIVRGEVGPVLTPTLQDCQAYGMQLIPISRQEYKKKHQVSFLASLRERLSVCGKNIYVVPEGGSNLLGVLGVADMITQFSQIPEYDLICAPVGSGGTLAGVIRQKGKTSVLGFSALKGASDLSGRISCWLPDAEKESFSLCHDYHFGGFGKTSARLSAFMRQFESTYNIPLDPVYTAKMMYGLCHKLFLGELSPETRILVLHTGGLQGLRNRNG
jgi:1-aminocyclopropane-1-carboxylate deaminase